MSIDVSTQAKLLVMKRLFVGVGDDLESPPISTVSDEVLVRCFNALFTTSDSYYASGEEEFASCFVTRVLSDNNLPLINIFDADFASMQADVFFDFVNNLYGDYMNFANFIQEN